MAEPNGNGNGNGTVTKVLIGVFFTVAALLLQAMLNMRTVSQQETTIRSLEGDLKLASERLAREVGERDNACEIRVAKILRENDRVKIEDVESRLNAITDKPTKE